MANFFTRHRGNLTRPVKNPTIYQSNRTYEKGKHIASGGYGRIHKVTRLSDQRVFATKTAKRHLNVQATIHKEIELLSALRHDFIISLEDEAGTALEPCLIMEMASSNVAAEGSRWRGDEGVARVMSRQILAALMHIHRHNIAHRDVKADNILVFMSSTGSPTFKLADFGCAENIVPAGQFHPDPSSGIPVMEIERRGPEIREHADMLDIYGFGSVLYGILTQGSLPDDFDSLSARYEAAMRWKLENSHLRALSRAAMAFIDLLLASNPRACPSAGQMLKHTWLRPRMDVPDIAAQEPAVSSVPDIEKEAGELPSSSDETARSLSELSVSRGRNHRVEPYPVRESLTLHAGHTPSNVGVRQGVIRTGQNLPRGTFQASNRPFLAGDVRFPRLVDQYRAGFAVPSRQRRKQ